MDVWGRVRKTVFGPPTTDWYVELSETRARLYKVRGGEILQQFTRSQHPEAPAGDHSRWYIPLSIETLTDGTRVERDMDAPLIVAEPVPGDPKGLAEIRILYPGGAVQKGLLVRLGPNGQHH